VMEQKSQAKITQPPRAVIVACLILVRVAPAWADDSPTDRDLQVGYCLGVGNVQLQGVPNAAAGIRSDLQARNRHFVLYLMSRGYLDMNTSRSTTMMAPIAQGEQDARDLVTIGTSCANQCVPNDSALPQLSQASQCFERCKSERFSSAKSNRIFNAAQTVPG
jgi:hypothetical protein